MDESILFKVGQRKPAIVCHCQRGRSKPCRIDPINDSEQKSPRHLKRYHLMTVTFYTDVIGHFDQQPYKLMWNIRINMLQNTTRWLITNRSDHSHFILEHTSANTLYFHSPDGSTAVKAIIIMRYVRWFNWRYEIRNLILKTGCNPKLDLEISSILTNDMMCPDDWQITMCLFELLLVVLRRLS